MEVFIKLHNGVDPNTNAPMPENKWTNGIHKFLTESGATVDETTCEEIGKQALKDLSPKLESGHLTKPELTMALLEAVMPLCPNSTSKTAASVRSISSIMSLVSTAMYRLAADFKAGVPLERLRLSAINLNEVVKSAQKKLPSIVARLKQNSTEVEKRLKKMVEYRASNPKTTDDSEK